MTERRAAAWLRAAAGLYRLGAGVYHGLYDRGVLGTDRLPVPVVSVGNLTAGGTGKTPSVRALAAAAAALGRRPAVLTRGYGGRRAGVLRDGAWDPGGAATAEEAGDEPLLLSRSLPGVPVVVGADRSRRAREFLDAGSVVDLFLLDDGFQHRRLQRSADLVLLDLRRPLGNGELLPAGPLREEPDALGRADHLLLTGGDEGEPVPGSTHAVLARYAPGVPFTRAWLTPARVRLWEGSASAGPSLRGLAVRGVAGIARPERFRAALEEAGAEVRGFSTYRDHHRFTAADVRREEEAARRVGAVPVTTAKDAVRLEPRLSPGAGWAVLEVELEVEGGWERLLRALLGLSARD